jgi:type II secretory pathway component PulF
METYRYKATTPEGEETAGVVEASSFDDAIQQLLDRDLREVQVFLLRPGKADSQAPPVELSAQEATVLSQQVAQVSEARIPLSEGLRAAAEETAEPRVAIALDWIADQIEQGRSLEDTLTDSGRLLPPYVSGLILTAARTGSLGEALFEIVELQQRTFALRREITRGYAYPLIVVAMASVIVIGTGYFVVGGMRAMMEEFELRLPFATEVLFWWRGTGIWVLGGFLLALVILALLYRLLGGAARWRRLLAAMPLFGVLWLWTGVAEWAGLLSVLLRHQVPLPEALRWAGRGARDASIGQLSRRLADGVARGRLLSQLMYSTRLIPASIIPLVEWGERSGGLSDSFRAGQEMFTKRARMRAHMLQAVVPPLLFLGVGSVVLFMVSALFLPLVSLISALS